MARNLLVQTLSGSYDNGTDLLALAKTAIKDNCSLSAVPVVQIICAHGVSSKPCQLILSDYSRLSTLPLNAQSGYYYFDTGVMTDNINVNIDSMLLTGVTGSADIQMNFYF